MKKSLKKKSPQNYPFESGAIEEQRPDLEGSGLTLFSRTEELQLPLMSFIRIVKNLCGIRRYRTEAPVRYRAAQEVKG